MDDKELKPCPFCGDKSALLLSNSNATGRPAILCQCGACMTVMMRDDWVGRSVIDKWNLRES